MERTEVIVKTLHTHACMCVFESEQVMVLQSQSHVTFSTYFSPSFSFVNVVHPANLKHFEINYGLFHNCWVDYCATYLKNDFSPLQPFMLVSVMDFTYSIVFEL